MDNKLRVWGFGVASVCDKITQLPKTQKVHKELLRIVQEFGWSLSPNVAKLPSIHQKLQRRNPSNSNSNSKGNTQSTGGMKAIRNQMEDLHIETSTRKSERIAAFNNDQSKPS